MASTLFCRESGCWNCTEHPWSTQRGLCLKWSSFICCHVKSILCDWCERSDTSRMTTHTGRWWLGTGFPQRVNLFRVAILEMIHDPGVCQIFCFFFHWFQLTGRELRKESAISRLHPSWRDGSSIQIYHDTSRQLPGQSCLAPSVCFPHRVDSWHLCLWIRGSCEVFKIWEVPHILWIKFSVSNPTT